MICHVVKHLWAGRAGACFILFVILVATAPTLRAAMIVNVSWGDGGRTNGLDPLDTDWWSSTSNTGNSIEVSVGSLGMISGTSGRGIHGTFPAQTLTNVGDTLTATFTFKTPATVGSAVSSFKVGLFNGSGTLGADISASTSSPNPIYNPVPGYWMDYDVKTGAPAGTENIAFREKDPVPGTGGVLLAAVGDFKNAAANGFPATTSGGSAYVFTPNTTYTGTFSITKSAGGLDLSGSLSQGTSLLSTFTMASDSSPSATSFDVLGFHANSNVFGSTTSNAAGADNGIDFTNITIEFNAVPEPATLSIFGMAALLLVAHTTRRRCR
jgi:hypothetical protein